MGQLNNMTCVSNKLMSVQLRSAATRFREWEEWKHFGKSPHRHWNQLATVFRPNLHPEIGRRPYVNFRLSLWSVLVVLICIGTGNILAWFTTALMFSVNIGSVSSLSNEVCKWTSIFMRHQRWNTSSLQVKQHISNFQCLHHLCGDSAQPWSSAAW